MVPVANTLKKLILSTMILSLLVTACNRTPSAIDEAEKDLDAMQGAWTLTYFEKDGVEVKLLSETQAINTGNSFMVKRGSQVLAAGTIRLITGTSPKAFESTYTQGPDTGKTFKGIYQIDGDTMKLSRAGTPDAERPTEFKTKSNSEGFFAVYTRATK